MTRPSTQTGWKAVQIATALFVNIVAIGASPSAAAACGGDCDQGGSVTVDELIKGVNIALGSSDVASCPVFDADNSLTVTVDELVAAVNDALNGCVAGLTPTPTATPTATPMSATPQPVVWVRRGPEIAYDQETTVGALALGPDHTLYAAIQRSLFARGDNLFRTTDAGDTWTSTLPGALGPITAVAADQIVAGAAYASRISGIGGYLLGSANAGTEWTPRPGLPGIGQLAIDPGDSGLWSIPNTRMGLFKSVDDGETWNEKRIAPAAPTGHQIVDSIIFHPTEENTLYCAGTFYLQNPPRRSAEAPRGLAKSIDGGEHWTFPASAGLERSTSLVIDPSNPSTVYAINGAGVSKSFDGGETWTLVGELQVRAIVLDPTSPRTLYAAGAPNVLAVYRSVDGGDHWSDMSDGLVYDFFGTQQPTYATGLLLDPVDKVLYAATPQGVYSAQVP